MKWEEFLKAPLEIRGIFRSLSESSKFEFRRPSQPSIFISYKYDEESFSEDQNIEYREWVNWLALNFQTYGVRPVWDKTMYSALQYNLDVPKEAIWAEICRVCVSTCNFFAPVITPGYLERIGWENGVRQASSSVGVSSDEYHQYQHLASIGDIVVVPIVRSVVWTNSTFKLPSSMYNNGKFFDFIDGNGRSEKSIEQMINHIYANFDGQHPAVQMEEKEIIELFIDWNLHHNEERRHQKVEDWTFRRSGVLNFMKACDDQVKIAVSEIDS